MDWDGVLLPWRELPVPPSGYRLGPVPLHRAGGSSLGLGMAGWGSSGTGNGRIGGSSGTGNGRIGGSSGIGILEELGGSQ